MRRDWQPGPGLGLTSVRFQGGPWDNLEGSWTWPAKRCQITFQGEYQLNVSSLTATWVPWADLEFPEVPLDQDQEGVVDLFQDPCEHRDPGRG